MGTAYVIPDFVTPQDESYLLQKIEALGGTEVESPGPSTRAFKSKGVASGWKTVKGRRLKEWGGSLMGKTLVSKPLPDFMVDAYPAVCKRVADATGLFSPPKSLNHVLVNEYLPGQGIMPHEDGRAYFPAVTTLSLGSHTILDLYQYRLGPADGQGGKSIDPTPICSIFLPARSLFVMKDTLYTNCLHGIAERASDSKADLAACVNPPADPVQDLDRSRRVSLTMRCVERTKKLF